MKPHFPALYGAARRLTRSSIDAEDLVQEVCIKACRNEEALQAMEYPRAWLLRTLYHQFVDDHRKQERMPDALATDVDDDRDEQATAPDTLQPDNETEQLMTVELIQKALKRLSEEQASLLLMHDLEGFSLPEIQAVTGLPLGTIKSKLHRTRIKLGRMLTPELRDVAVAGTGQG